MSFEKFHCMLVEGKEKNEREEGRELQYTIVILSVKWNSETAPEYVSISDFK